MAIAAAVVITALYEGIVIMVARIKCPRVESKSS
jgi:hypothetical protein